MPRTLAAQSCTPWLGVPSWSGSYTLVGHAAGTDQVLDYYITADLQSTSSGMVLPQSPDQSCALPINWVTGNPGTATGSVNIAETLSTCGTATLTGSGALSSLSARLVIDAAQAKFTFSVNPLQNVIIDYGGCVSEAGQYPYPDYPLALDLTNWPSFALPATPQPLSRTMSFDSIPEGSTIVVHWTLTFNLTPSVIPPSGPSITSLSPATASAGGAGFPLTVNGTGFVAGAVVQWNGTALNTTVVSATELTATVPAGLIASAGTAIITVVAGGATLGTAPFTVNPPGQSCTFTFTPASASVGASGGPGSVAVSASRTDCTWTATASAPWITFSNATITGSGTLNYNVAVNPAGTSRMAAIVVGAASFTIEQGGITCTFSLPDSSQAFAAAGATGSVDVQAPPGCSWNASSNIPWVSIVPPAGGTGDGSASFSVAPNVSSSARSGTLTIANLLYTVTQAGAGSPATCAGSVAAPATVAIEGRTEVLADFVLTCSGLSGSLLADISLTLNVNVTNALANGTTDAVLTVNGVAPKNGVVSGYNRLTWQGVALTPAGNGTAVVTITKVRGDATLLAGPGSAQPRPITGEVSVSGLIPVTADTQTMANASRALVFTKLQANPPAGGAQTTIPLLFQESRAAGFQAGATRLRMVLNKVPAGLQVYAPVFPSEGTTRAQLYSADLNGLGGVPLAGSALASGVYQLLTVTSGTATATWLVLAANNAQVETLTFPLLVLNAATGDLNQITLSGSLAPVSDVSIASATAPIPRYRDLSVPQKLVNLRITTSLQTPVGSTLRPAAKESPYLVSREAVTVGSNLMFVSQVVNDTSDPEQSATNVVIRNTLPTGLSLVSCAATGAPCGGSGSQVQVNYGTLGPGQSATVTVVAQVGSTVPDGSVVEDPVSASSDQVNLDLAAGTSSTSFIVLNGPVVAAGSPASGGGTSQEFTFQFSHSGGYQNLSVVNVLMNRFLDGRNACYLAYVVQSSTLILVNDAGAAGGPYAGSVTLGNSSAIENSQCAVRLVSALPNGNSLTLKLNITFKPSFAGNRVTYVAARDQGQGNTDWQALGVWQVLPAPPGGSIGVTGVTPARGSGPAGSARHLTFTLTDTKGTGDFGVINVLINNFIDGRQACYLAYIAPSNTLVLVNDGGAAGGPYAGAMALDGGNTGIENGQCRVSGAGSSVAYSANTMTLTLTITFKAAFAGNRVVYVAGRDRLDGNNTDWQAVGTWTVQ